MPEIDLRIDLAEALHRLNRMEEKLDKILAMLEPLMHPPIIVEKPSWDDKMAEFQNFIAEKLKE